MTKIEQLLPGLEPALLQEMEQVAILKKVDAGALLLSTGQNILHTMVVLEGQVKLFREDDDGNEFFMYHLLPGDACAISMVCSLDQRKSAVTARAVSDATLLAIPLDASENWLRKYPSWNRFVISTFRTRYEELLQTIDHIAFRNMDERLEFYLKRHVASSGERILKLTHADIAQELNSSREVITRLLRKLSDRGKVKLSRSYLEILEL